MTSLADVDAGVRAALAAYTHALDDGRAEDVVATFCPDGVVDIPAVMRLLGERGFEGPVVVEQDLANDSPVPPLELARRNLNSLGVFQ